MQNFKQTFMLVDLSALAYGMLYSIGKSGLCSNEGIPTFVIYGIFNQLLHIQRIIKSDNIIFACDSRHSLRHDIYPEYKEKRKKKTKEKTPEEKKLYEDTHKQIIALRRKILPYIGFKNIFMQSGYEADDIIAVICKGYPHARIIIVSRDKDLYQLLSNNVSIFDPVSKKTFSKLNFINKYGIPPERWGEVKRYSGCTTDDVEGIEGVGETKTIKYLLGKQPKGKILDRINSPEGKAIVKRNKDLVVLPYPGTKKCVVVPNQFNPKNFKKVCQKLDFRSILMTINEYNYR